MAQDALVTEADKELLRWVTKGREVVSDKSGMKVYDQAGEPRMRPISAQEMMCVLKRVAQLEKIAEPDDEEVPPLRSLTAEAARRSAFTG